MQNALRTTIFYLLLHYRSKTAMKMIKRLVKQLVFACTLCIVSTVFAQDSRYFLHTVTKGQGLYSISRMYNVTEDEIIKLNPGSEKVIKIGQELKIPHKQESNNEQKFHTIKPGETLYRLSIENRVSVKNICDANPGLSVEQFKAGQVIVIPAPTDEDPLESTLQNAPTELVTEVVTPETTENAEVAQFKKEHVVKRKETIYRISKLYNISQAELIEANPQLKHSKLRTGDVINIPFTKEEQQEQKEELLETTKQIEDISDEALFTLNEEQTRHLERIKAALILPFELDDSITTEQKKMIEFYQGVLMALDKLKQENVSVELVVLDSEGEDKSIKPLLESDKMDSVNIIFGPKFSNHIKEASEYSAKNGIPLVLPINANADDVYGNPYVYQLNTPQSYFMQEIYDHFLKQFPNSNVIILDDGEYKKNDFIDGLKLSLNDAGIPHITMPIDTAAQPYIDTLHLERQNIFILNSSSSAPLTDMIPVLQLVNRNKPEGVETHLFGYPEYQIYAANHLEEFYEIDTWFYSWFYTNNTLPEAEQFNSQFRKAFSRQMMISYPSFASYGYDMAYYFLKGLATFGTEFSNHLDEIETTPVQMGFKFERVNNWGGFINRKVFFVHLSNDYKVSKIDFEK